MSINWQDVFITIGSTVGGGGLALGAAACGCDGVLLDPPLPLDPGASPASVVFAAENCHGTLVEAAFDGNVSRMVLLCRTGSIRDCPLTATSGASELSSRPAAGSAEQYVLSFLQEVRTEDVEIAKIGPKGERMLQVLLNLRFPG